MARVPSKLRLSTALNSRQNSQTPVSFASVKAQKGSIANGQYWKQTPPATGNDKLQLREKAIDFYTKDERDFRSFAVKEYDAHQETARKSHKEKLKDIVRRVY